MIFIYLTYNYTKREEYYTIIHLHMYFMHLKIERLLGSITINTNVFNEEMIIFMGHED